MTLNPVESDALVRLQTELGHRFADPELLLEALAHRSYVSENEGLESYERLEFLGDAVLQLAVTHYLFEHYPGLSEGEMAKVRAAVVNEGALADVAGRIGIPDALLLGKGEEMTGGRAKSSLLSDAVESVLGAVYLEAGFAACRRIVLRHLIPLITERSVTPGRLDFKTRLQEVLAKQGRYPVYQVSEEGPEHEKVFTAEVRGGGRLLGVGRGTSKKRAEREAARNAFATLGLVAPEASNGDGEEDDA